MKAKEKTETTAYWFERSKHWCQYPVATNNPRGLDVGEPGSRPRKALRNRYKTLLAARSTKAPSFKAWLRAGA